ncbi:DEAD/DEAH box helicase [Lentilactobacillus sp. Marseille-Q4993]|uniref:DEAD/DEAH box helicase n=1 Tax=Lentilactobacillus sp. Marseille-Q4993 TaxID=3039492 RepID=UPI0024BC90E5|nr:DEAD/DEAH box helicase [Lentilactobacillus sp. Marseille-Q4993]
MLPEFKEHMDKLGYEKLSPIQEKVYKPLSQGRSVVGISPTGSGKTVAFTLPLLERIDQNGEVSLLILEPSAELAMQVFNVVSEWGKLIGLKTQSAIGGANISRQIDKLKDHPNIVVGTVGRVSELISMRKLAIDRLDSIVIDEADDLLSDTTLESVRDIVDNAPVNVILGFFSATKSDIVEHIDRWFNQAIEFIDTTNIDDTRGNVAHRFLEVSNHKKPAMLIRLMADKHFSALVFFDKMVTLQKAYSTLTHRGIKNISKLTSDQSKMSRQKAVKDFRTKKSQLLLSTDVSARGIDIIDLPAVVNYELPSDERTYIHRTGRTGRMHHDGMIINLGDDHDFRDLKKLVGADYDLKPIYFDGNVLSETKPKVNKAEVKQEPKSPEHNDGNKWNSQEKATSKSHQSVVAPKKHVKKNKHSKRKGMRRKHNPAN